MENGEIPPDLLERLLASTQGLNQAFNDLKRIVDALVVERNRAEADRVAYQKVTKRLRHALIAVGLSEGMADQILLENLTPEQLADLKEGE